MINYIEGNLFDSKAEALVNTVNTTGIMGKGIALQFKKAFPYNYKVYQAACADKTFNIGDLIVTEEESLLYGRKIIIDLPTKKDWRKPAEYSYIETGLNKLVAVIQEKEIKSIALPALGAGNGGLNWNTVKALMEKSLSGLDCDISIYQPNALIIEVMNKERVKLTPARAMLLAVLFEFVKSGEFVSEFAAEKVAYFLQQFGAKDVFNLNFTPNFYGPYSGKVKRVLYYLNGSYITGYSAMDKKPFEELGIVMDTEQEVINYLSKKENIYYLEMANKTKLFLSGFYSPFGLELLSTINFIAQKRQTTDLTVISTDLDNWSFRKRTLFSNKRFVELAVKKLIDHKLLEF